MCESFALIRARLLAEHYRPVLYLSFQCWAHGKFRACVSAESKRERRRHEFYCPSCKFRCPVSVLGVGLVKPGPLPGVEQVQVSAQQQAMSNFESKRKKGGTATKRRKHGPPLLTGHIAPGPFKHSHPWNPAKGRGTSGETAAL